MVYMGWYMCTLSSCSLSLLNPSKQPSISHLLEIAFINITDDLHITKYNVIVFYCRSNELPQTWWLKTTQIYYLIALQVISQAWVSLRVPNLSPIPKFKSHVFLLPPFLNSFFAFLKPWKSLKPVETQRGSNHQDLEILASHSSTLAQKIPLMEEPGRLQSMGSLRVRRD